MRILTIAIPQTPGKCRWCGCTWDDPCPPGCGWANRDQTLCTECVDVDKLVRTKAGRRTLVEGYQIGAEAAS